MYEYLNSPISHLLHELSERCWWECCVAIKWINEASARRHVNDCRTIRDKIVQETATATSILEVGNCDVSEAIIFVIIHLNFLLEELVVNIELVDLFKLFRLREFLVQLSVDSFVELTNEIVNLLDSGE